MRHLAWSGIGFTLLVTMITFQYYFLINGFWTKANLQFSKTWFTLPDKSISIFLSEEFGSSLATYGNTAAGAFKCALSMVVAFAAISGRGGPLEAIVMIIFGVVLYEVNRQLIGLFSTDVGGSMSIFLFGGMYGSAVSFILSICRQKSPIQSHIHFQSSRANVAWALVGASFCWVLFPVLNMDVPIINFNGTIGGISTVYCISSTVVTSVAMSLIMHG